MRISMSRSVQPLALLALALTLCQLVAGDVAGRTAAAKLLPTATIAGIRAGLTAKNFTCHDLIFEQLRRIDAYNQQLRALINVTRESALAAATAKDAAGIAGSLHCVPVVVKDNIDVAQVPTTNGATPMLNMVPNKTNLMVEKIVSAGGIVIGKSNMAEMSDSGTSSNSTVGGLCSNPWDLSRSCLGSSGGSGAAVAAGLAVIGLGTDTEGSVIGPCVAAGLVCVRPSATAMFNQMMPGVYPAFSRQDMLGIMARTIDDYTAVYDAVYSTSVTQSIANANQLSNITVRVLRNFYESFPIGGGMSYSPDANMVQLHNRTIGWLANLNATIDEYKLSSADLTAKLTQIITATASKPACSKSCMNDSINAYLQRYGSAGPFMSTMDLWNVRQGFPVLYQEKLNFTLNQNASDACNDNGTCKSYVDARATVTQLLMEMKGNSTVMAMPFSAQLPQLNGVEPGLADQISPALNPYSGWPSLALPVGFVQINSSISLPVGMVLMAGEGEEATLLRVAKVYLAAHHEQKSPTATPELQVSAGPRVVGSITVVLVAAALVAGLRITV